MNDYTKYIGSSEACELFQVSVGTLRKWDREGKIDTYRTPGKHRRYSTQLFTKISNCITILLNNRVH